MLRVCRCIGLACRDQATGDRAPWHCGGSDGKGVMRGNRYAGAGKGKGNGRNKGTQDKHGRYKLSKRLMGILRHHACKGTPLDQQYVEDDGSPLFTPYVLLSEIVSTWILGSSPR